MSAYTEQTVAERLSSLVNTQQAIETVSRWIIYHRKRHSQSVALWEKEFRKADKDQQLVFIYLANDIIQGSRKKGIEFVKEFSKILKSCLADLGRGCDEETLRKVNRVLSVWEDRQVYPSTFINDLRKALNRTSSSSFSPPRQQLSYQSSDAPPMPAELLPSSSHQPESPIARALRLVEENEVSADIFNDKVASIRPGVLSGDVLHKVANANEFTALAQEVDDASRAVAELKRVLDEDTQRRNTLVQLLTESLERQETAINRTASRLQDCESKASLIEDVKSRMKAMLPKFPQVYASAGMRPPPQQAAAAVPSAVRDAPASPSSAVVGAKVFGEEFNADFDDDMHMDESDGEADGPSKKQRIEPPGPASSADAGLPALDAGSLSYQEIMRSLEQFTAVTSANAGSTPPPLPFASPAPFTPQPTKPTPLLSPPGPRSAYGAPAPAASANGYAQSSAGLAAYDPSNPTPFTPAPAQPIKPVRAVAVPANYGHPAPHAGPRPWNPQFRS
eukprot:TRINITY_DN8427_c0_g1_i2.p1 TRINITY_DN8427_c0_g1~~TRINITY_DN8427_c0_g1_i2.p1  ORF type:complete len:506 (+),score=111.64 TRINITY_DN8427_c0_g1_i2:109-1626(+)